jgi:hypothetical protein
MRGLTLFRTKKDSPAASATAGPEPAAADMRGRADEINDPSPYGWKVMWEALKTEPPSDDDATLTQELGLDQEREVTSAYGGSDWATEFSGTRHGRHVALRMGIIPKITGKGYNEVVLDAVVPAFRIGVVDGRPSLEDGGTPELAGLLAGLAAAPDVWKKLEVEGGPQGIVARRPVTAHSQGYLYDLWLIERIADRLGA